LDPTARGGYAYVTTTQDLNDAVNPATDLNLVDNSEKGASIMGNVYAQLEIIKGLTFNTSLGITGNAQNNFRYTKPRQNGNLVFPDAESSEHFEFGYSPKIENYLTFAKSLGQHDFLVMAGNTYENYQEGRSVDITGKGYINDEVRIATVAREKNISGNNAWHNSYLSYFGRVNYSFKNKYLITFNMRADASPKFAPSNRWGQFPSVAVGWKLHEENFLNSVDWLTQLKLRGSYGITGNDAIGNYRYFSSVHSRSSYAFNSHGFGGINYNGSTINTLASPIIKWESTKNTSIGVDLALLRNKIEFSADYFVKNSYDILFGVPQPPSLGMGNNGGGGDAIVNAASCENKGVELSLTYNGKVGDLSFQVSGNATFVKNEVTSLGSGKPYNAGSFGFYSTNRTEKGQPIGYFYGFKTDKVYVNQAQVDQDNQAARDAALIKDPNLTAVELAKIYYQESSTSGGDIRFKDLNGDGKITDDDRAYLGTSIPKANFGLTANANYKGFDFFMAWSGVSGNSILYNFGYWMEGMIRPFNSTTAVLDRWKSESDPGDGKTPRAVKTDPSKNLRMSDRFVYDGSYFRLKLLSLGYTLPKSVVNKISMGTVSNLRVYVSSDNLITFTKYPGYNPEIGGDQYQPNLIRGSDGGAWPSARTIRFGASLTF
jgi:TonB-linked SusC/RagA family outer membrane protein